MNCILSSAIGFISFILIYLIAVVYSKCVYVPNMHKQLENRAKNLPAKINTVGRKAIFYGMCRNAMPNLKKVKNNIIILSKFFTECKFIILENGSIDDTREFIEQWRDEDDRMTIVNGDGEEAKRAVDLFAKAVPNSDPWKGPKRIARYASLRNQLHGTVKNMVLSGKFDPSHFICLDLDQNVTIDEKGFYDSLQKMAEDVNVVACTAYGKTTKPWKIPLTSYIYDTYAFLDDWLVNNGTDRNKTKHIWSEKINVTNKNFHQVISNFGGLSIYRNTQEFMDNFYAVENIEKNKCDCEHIGFHKRLQVGQKNAQLLIGFETFFDNQ